MKRKGLLDYCLVGLSIRNFQPFFVFLLLLKFQAFASLSLFHVNYVKKPPVTYTVGSIIFSTFLMKFHFSDKMFLGRCCCCEIREAGGGKGAIQLGHGGKGGGD